MLYLYLFFEAHLTLLYSKIKLQIATIMVIPIPKIAKARCPDKKLILTIPSNKRIWVELYKQLFSVSS